MLLFREFFREALRKPSLLEKRHVEIPSFAPGSTLAEVLKAAGLLEAARKGEVLVIVSGHLARPEEFNEIVLGEQDSLAIIKPAVGG